MSNETPKCVECNRDRTPSDIDYNPMQVIAGQQLGWYSGDDGEFCGECMAKILGGRS